jgi:hypothetical protein
MRDDDRRDDLEALRREFSAEDGTFMLRIRVDLVWDRDAFSRLATTMQRYCEQHAKEETCERWVAFGFWYLSWFVQSWTTHPNFPRPGPPEYYDMAYERLSDLAYWCFLGESPYLPGTGFEPL